MVRLGEGPWRIGTPLKAAIATRLLKKTKRHFLPRSGLPNTIMLDRAPREPLRAISSPPVAQTMPWSFKLPTAAGAEVRMKRNWVLDEEVFRCRKMQRIWGKEILCIFRHPTCASWRV